MLSTVALSVFVALFPYVPVLLFAHHVRIETTLICTGVVFVISTVAWAFHMISIKRNQWSAKFLSFLGMIVKLIHIPAYVLLFIVGAGGVVFIHFIVVSAIIFVFDCITIFLSGGIVLLAILRARAANKIKAIPMVIFSVCSFVFCIDVISSVVLYFYIKKRKYLDFLV